ncbi:hypothetical protein V6N13_090238 [Hibiscus sabdariffa]
MTLNEELLEARPTIVIRAESTVATQGVVDEWKLPRQDWVKLNIDDAVRLIDGKCCVINAELWTIFMGLMYTWICKYCKVEVELDSRESIQCIKKVDARRVGNALVIVIVIQELIRRDWEIILSHVHREFNVVADKLVITMCGPPLGEISF